MVEVNGMNSILLCFDDCHMEYFTYAGLTFKWTDWLCTMYVKVECSII